MKEKIVALILGIALITTSWLAFSKPTQALMVTSSLGNDSFSKMLLALFNPQSNVDNSGSATTASGAAPSGTTTSPTSTESTTGAVNNDTTGLNTGGSINPSPPVSNPSAGSTDGTVTPSAITSTNPDSSTSTVGATTPASGPAPATITAPTPVPAPVPSAITSTTTTTTLLTTAEKNYQKYLSHYLAHEVPIVNTYRTNYNGSLAQALVGRAIWYMEHGYMVYGHHKYWDTGYIDCSNYVSLVYRDFGYTVTSAARNYTTVGTKVEGVYSKKLSTGKYTLVGVDKLKPGDIFTYWAKDANGVKYISHVALYMGVVNGKPCVINTRKEHPTAIGIIDSFSYWYGENLYSVRRVLPASAQTPNTGVKLSNPVIPAIYQLKPQNPVIMPKDLAKGF